MPSAVPGLILRGTARRNSLSRRRAMAEVSTARLMSAMSPGPPAGANEKGDGIELVLRASRGDEAAFAEIYQRHHAMVFQVSSRLVVNGADGADLTQEVFLKAWEKLPSLREPERFKSWLLRIVVNTAFNWRTRHQRERAALRQLQQPERNSPAAFEPAIDRESSVALGQALVQLSPKLRTAVVLRYVAGLAYADVARAMKCGEITARTRVARGLTELGKRLARRQEP